MRRSRFVEFSNLEVFVAVSESDTLSEAARKLKVTQSAVSQTIMSLEESTRCTLIIRRSKPIKLTPAGLRLLQYAHNVLSETTKIINSLSSQQAGQIPRLNIGMIDSFADTLGLEIVGGIKPLVGRVALKTGLNASLTDAFVSRSLDLLITADPISKEPHLDRVKLLRDPFLVIAPSSAHGKNIQSLARELPFIHYSPESLIGGQTDIIARRVNIEFDAQFELDSTQSLMQFVGAGHGWAILSALCLVRYDHLLDGVSIADLDNGKHAREIALVSRRQEIEQLPERIAQICSESFNRNVTAKFSRIAPWVNKQCYKLC